MPAFRLRIGAIAIALGMLLTHIGINPALAILVTASAIAFGFFLHRRALLIAGVGMLLGAFWSFGVMKHQQTQPLVQHRVLDKGLVGTVASVRQSERGSYIVTVKADNTGKAYPPVATVITPNLVSVGDRLSVRCGWAARDEGQACFSREIERLGVAKTAWSWALISARIHARIQEALQRALPEPEASVAAAMVFGYGDTLPPSIKSQFRTTGTSHLLVASGMQVVLTIHVLERLLLLLGLTRRVRALVLAPMALGLLIVIGVSPSSIRGAVMGYLPVLSLTMGRGRMGLHTLIITGGAMALADPTVLTQMSFQLSFLATAGILVITPAIQEGLSAFVSTRWASELATTLGATVATLPVISIAFGMVNPAIIITNMVLVDAVVWIMLLTTVVVLFGFISAPLASVAGTPLTIVLWIVLGVLQWSSQAMTQHPFASAALGVAIVALVLAPILIKFYVVLRTRVHSATRGHPAPTMEQSAL